MPLFPLPIEQFAGLNLVGAVDEEGFSGAIDMLNIDLDKSGVIRSRDGFAKFTSSAATAAYHSLGPYYKTDGTRQLIAVFGGGSGAINALNTSGAVVAAQASASSAYGSIARFSAPGSEFAYVAVSQATGAATIYRWDGTFWTTPTWVTTTPTGRHLATWQNRLANARYASTTNGNSVSTIRFSAISTATPPAATPETWNANDFVELSPGDGEEITALLPWRDSLFAFKESKFFVFYGEDTDATGQPAFNYRPIYGQGLASAGGQSSYRAVAAAPDGVFFLNRRGVWFTSGGPPTLVSQAIDPIFRGNVSSFYQGGTLNQGAINQVAMTWHDNRLYIAFPSGSSTTNDKVLVYDPANGYWLLWSIPASAMSTFRVSNVDELAFAFSGSLVALPPPRTLSLSVAGGGTLANGSYFYRVTALNAAGETTGSDELPVVISGGVNLPTISWTAVSGATGYKVYRGTSTGAENVFFSVGNVLTFADTGTAGTGGTVPVSNTATTAGFDIVRYNITSGYTLDGGDGLTTGAAITSRYQSGYDNIAPPRRFAAHYLFGNTRKRLRKWKVTGSGTVSIAIAHDFKAAGTASTLTLGTPPAIADKWHNVATRGQLLSYIFSSTAAWSVQKLTAYLAGSEPPLLGNPSDK